MFEVGDKVRYVPCQYMWRSGNCGRVVEVVPGSVYPYRVKFSDALEPVLFSEAELKVA